MNKTTTQKQNLIPEIDTENIIPELVEVIHASSLSTMKKYLFSSCADIEKLMKKSESFSIISLTLDTKNKSTELKSLAPRGANPRVKTNWMPERHGTR